MGETGRRAPLAALALGVSILVVLGGTGVFAAAFPVHQIPGDPGSCQTCHGAASSGMVAGAPLDNRVCYSCHTDARGPVFDRALFEQGAHGPFWNPRSHTPVARDKRASSQRKGLCVNCHDPHEKAPGRALVWLGTEQDSTALCVSCHLDTQAYGAWPGLRVYAESPHGNPLAGVARRGAGLAVGECLNCHDPHGRGNQKLLVSPWGSEFCLAAGCHDGSAATGLWPGKGAYQMAGGVHANPPAVPKTGVRRTYPGRDAAAGTCSTCHNPHGTLDFRTGLLTPGMTNAAGAELCYQCHGELRFTFSALSHHRVDEPGTDMSCRTCHNPHVVNRLGQTVSDPHRPNVAMAADDSFCLRCHDGSYGMAADVRLELSSASTPGTFAAGGQNLHYYHVTQRGAKCTSCHDPHGSSNRALIRTTIQFEKPGYPAKAGCSGGPAGAICH